MPFNQVQSFAKKYGIEAMQSRIEKTNTNQQFFRSKYSYQFLMICKNDLPFNGREFFLHEAYKIKWLKTHNDPNCSRLHTILIGANDKPDDEKFKCLRLADSHSRITIIGHHKLNTDYFYYDQNTKIHYKDIIDLIRHNVVSENLLLKYDTDNPFDERALRITFISCNVGVNTYKPSLANRMFDYACNHQQKPLRIEMTAPLMLCGPLLTEKHEKFGISNPPSKASWSLNSLHKRYATLPYYQGKFFLFDNSAGLFSFFYPKYRPGNHKIIFKFDEETIVAGKIKPKILTPEEENSHYKSSKTVNHQNQSGPEKNKMALAIRTAMTISTVSTGGVISASSVEGAINVVSAIF